MEERGREGERKGRNGEKGKIGSEGGSEVSRKVDNEQVSEGLKEERKKQEVREGGKGKHYTSAKKM